MSDIIDRRLNGKNKSAGNRERFIKRYKEQIKKSVSDVINNRSIKDSRKNGDVSIDTRDISEPYFGNSGEGSWDYVKPGNKDYNRGDQFKRKQSGDDKGNSASDSTDPLEDEFTFTLSREEFLKFFFEDLELPALIERELGEIPEVKNQRAGFTTAGTASALHILRSMRGALGRRIGVNGKERRRLKEIEKMLGALEENDYLREMLLEEAKEIHIKIAKTAFLDPIDLRYRNTIAVPKPSTKAVMFCVLDVSASMGVDEKDIAKRFFILLYLFLTKNYKDVDVVFIRHHTTAKEVSEEEFFNSRESGGTIVSSALELIDELITKKYSGSEWNAYVAQASDGDNFENDCSKCYEIMDTKILPKVQYFAYIEITRYKHQDLWYNYKGLRSIHKNMEIKHVKETNEIYPVFCELFKKRSA